MKLLLSTVFALLIAATVMVAQNTMSISYGQFTVTYQNQSQSDPITLPMIEGKALTGSKERFGIFLHASQGSNTFAEILDGSGKIVRTLSINEFLGKTSSDGVKLLSNKVLGLGRIAETIHEVKVSSGTVQLISRALLGGEKGNAGSPQQIIVTFSLAGNSTQPLALHLTLPVEGNVELKGNAMILSGKSAPAAIFVSGFPAVNKFEIQKNVISITTPAVELSGETPLCWLVCGGVSGGYLASAKSAAAAQAAAFIKANADPNITIVNTVSKMNAQPGDTVTYLVVCKNSGMSEATNIVLSSPVPVGTSYVEGTASEKGTELSFQRDAATAPQVSPVKTILWKLKDALKAGGEFTVGFKVLVR